MANENKDHIIEYEEIFKSDPGRNIKASSGLINTIIVLIIYGFFVISNIIGAFAPPVDPAKNLNQTLYLDDYKHLIIYDDLEFENAVKYDLNKAIFYKFTYEDINYTILTRNSNYNLEELDIEKVLTGEITKWSDGSEISLVYDSSQTISKYAKDNPNFVNFLTFYNYTELAWANALIFFLMLIPIALLLFKDIKNDTFTFFKDKEYDGPKRLLASIVPLLLVSYGSGIVANLLSMIFGIGGSSENQQLIELMFSSNAKFIMLINVVILAPIIEELVFRKGIFNMFKNKKVAMIVSSVTFTLIHLVTESVSLFSGGFDIMKIIELIILIIPYASMAIFLSYTYKKNDENITLLILLHAIVNGISGIAILLV